MIIAVDFDGTCVTHDYPKLGKDIGAVEVLRELVDKQHQLILWTMRSNNNDFPGQNDTIVNTGLTDALNWFKENKIIQLQKQIKNKTDPCYPSPSLQTYTPL